MKLSTQKYQKGKMETPEKYPLVLDDGGRNLSKRTQQSNDCVVRAFAIVSEVPYDEVYDRLAKAGRKPCEGFFSHEWLGRRQGKETFAGYFERRKHKGLNALNFAKHFPKGKFVLETDNHMWAVIDGVARDLWRLKPQTRPLEGCWQYVKAKK